MVYKLFECSANIPITAAESTGSAPEKNPQRKRRNVSRKERKALSVKDRKCGEMEEVVAKISHESKRLRDCRIGDFGTARAAF